MLQWGAVLVSAGAAEGVDSSSLRFLTASALEARREEEEEQERVMEELEVLMRLTNVPWSEGQLTFQDWNVPWSKGQVLSWTEKEKEVR